MSTNNSEPEISKRQMFIQDLHINNVLFNFTIHVQYFCYLCTMDLLVPQIHGRCTMDLLVPQIHGTYTVDLLFRKWYRRSVVPGLSWLPCPGLGWKPVLRFSFSVSSRPAILKSVFLVFRFLFRTLALPSPGLGW
jgi:hypothetical protein